MSLKGEYHRLKTSEEEAEEEEDSPPTQVLLHTTNFAKGSRWNHVENLDEFFETVYQYQQNNGLAAIALADVMEILQFGFIVSFATFIVTCLRFRILWADKVPIVETNMTRDVLFSDLFDLSQLKTIPDSFTLLLFLMMAVLFGVQRTLRAGWRFYRFWEMRNFYSDALKIAPHQLRDCTWPDVVKRLKEAQKDVMINIRKQELTELDIYHRILRFKNYMVAFVNKSILPCRISIPFFGDKLFFTRGLLFNYELLLFWGPGAPFKNSFHLDEQYKSASRKQELVRKLQFRITLLALVNLLFCPFILLYQVLYSFFSYAEVVKREPGVFGKRCWSLYGKYFFRNFNELDHELNMRLGFAYKGASRYVDAFTSPLLVILAKNVVFFAGSLLGVLVVMTIIQEDLLTAHNLLAIISLLGLVVTVGVLFIPDENAVRCPAQHMAEVLNHVQCMPDLWKEQPHLVEVYSEFTQMFQFKVATLLDDLLSPAVTPFVLYFLLRPRAADIIDFFRNFTIDVSGVGDVCSFAEMNVKKHGNPHWMSAGMTRANQYEQAELGKTEVSLIDFANKNPHWKPSEDETEFISQLKESVEEMESGTNSQTAKQQQQSVEESLRYISLDQSTLQSSVPESLKWSVWNIRPGQQEGPKHATAEQGVGMNPMHLHQLHDLQKHNASTQQPTSSSCATATTQGLQRATWVTATVSPMPMSELKEPLLGPSTEQCNEQPVASTAIHMPPSS